MSIPNIRQNRFKRHFFASNHPKNLPNHCFPSNRPFFRPAFWPKRQWKITLFFNQNNVKNRSAFTLSNIKKCHNLIKTTSKNPTYSDRGFCGGEAGICISAECKNDVLETERAAGDDRVRQRRCPVRSTEIPKNDIKKPDLFGSGFLWRRSRDLYFSGV